METRTWWLKPPRPGSVVAVERAGPGAGLPGLSPHGTAWSAVLLGSLYAFVLVSVKWGNSAPDSQGC